MRQREGIEPRYEHDIVGADAVSKAEGHINGADMARAPRRTPRGRRPGHVTRAESGTREILWVLLR
jgi:hypothetical protein